MTALFRLLTLHVLGGGGGHFKTADEAYNEGVTMLTCLRLTLKAMYIVVLLFVKKIHY